jgi:hypothetical protein
MNDDAVTPADLSRELGRPQRQIRRFLRATHGKLTTETRWLLSPQQADVVRTHFARS